MSENVNNLIKREHIIQDKFTEIMLDKKVYPLIAIKKAISNFLNDIYVRIEEDNTKYIVDLKLQDKKADIEKIIGEFYNQCLRETLRYEISVETKNLRDLIVGRALYTTCIELDKEDTNQEQMEKSINEDESQEEYSLEDIAVNWFEKYKGLEEKEC